MERRPFDGECTELTSIYDKDILFIRHVDSPSAVTLAGLLEVLRSPVVLLHPRIDDLVPALDARRAANSFRRQILPCYDVRHLLLLPLHVFVQPGTEGDSVMERIGTRIPSIKFHCSLILLLDLPRLFPLRRVGVLHDLLDLLLCFLQFLQHPPLLSRLCLDHLLDRSRVDFGQFLLVVRDQLLRDRQFLRHVLLLVRGKPIRDVLVVEGVSIPGRVDQIPLFLLRRDHHRPEGQTFDRKFFLLGRGS